MQALNAQSPTRQPWSPGTIGVVCILVSLAIPLMWPTLPPLVDLMGHVGRYHIQLNIDKSPDLQRFFAVDWKLLPNLGVDVLVYALGPLLGVGLATKIVVMLIPVMTGAGVLAIAREIHGRIPPTAIFALPLVFHYPFQFGFVNFSLGMALALLGFALWLRMGRYEQARLRAVFFLFIAPVIYVCHVSAWGAFGVIIFCAGLVARLKDGQPWIRGAFYAALDCMPLSLPAFFMLAWREEGIEGLNQWFHWRVIIEWLAAVLRSHWKIFDLASAAALYGFSVAPIVFRRILRYDLRLLIPAVALAALAVLIPNMISGSYFSGVRLIPFALALAIIGIETREEARARTIQWFWIAGFVFLFLRIAAHTVDYAIADQRNLRDLQALDHVTRGSRIATLVGPRCHRWEPSRHLHLPELAALRKDAFTNGHWQVPGQQIMTVKYRAGNPIVSDRSQFVQVSGCVNGFPTVADRLRSIPLASFDYVWLVEVPSTDWPRDQRLSPLWTNGSSIIYRIEKPQER